MPIRTALPVSTPAITPGQAPATAQPEGKAKNVELVGWIGGEASAIAADGHYAYVGIGPRLIILDVANPDQPLVVGQGAILPEVIRDVAVVDGYAYIADGETGVYVINITNPKQPAIVGFPVVTGNAVHITVAGGYAYVAEASGSRSGRVVNGGLRILRLADPTHLTQVGFSERVGGYNSVTVAGYYAYATGGGLHIFDITDPRRPTEVGVYGGTPNAFDVAVVGAYAYVTDAGGFKGPGALHIVDVSNPAQPTRVSVFAGPAPYMHVLVAGTYAHVVTTAGLHILDTADPARPREVGVYRAAVMDIALAGTYVYLAGGYYGHALYIINVARPERPTEVGFYDTPRFALDVAVVGYYAYIAHSDGLLVIDVSDPRAPVQVGASTPMFAWGVAISGNYAYVASSEVGLRILNITDPTLPAEVGSVRTGAAAYKGC